MEFEKLSVCLVGDGACTCICYLFRTISGIQIYLIKTSSPYGDQRLVLTWWNSIIGSRVGFRTKV